MQGSSIGGLPQAQGVSPDRTPDGPHANVRIGGRQEWSWPEEAAERLASATISADLSITDALVRLDEAGTGVLLVVDQPGRLLGIVTDGDFRRHLLSGESLDRPCRSIASTEPVTASPGVTRDEALSLMDTARDFLINHLPIIDREGHLVDLILRSDLTSAQPFGLSAVIMAGGFGTRLRPLTDAVPKPMLPVGDRPLLELTIQRLREAGIKQVSLTTHYLADRISTHFGNGQEFGVDIHYVPEDRPLGTAGSLRLVERGDTPVLVLNGDILTTVNFREMLAYHREHGAEATVAVRKFELQVPYGVIDCAGARVRALREKPKQPFLVNAGIYLLEPSAIEAIPPGERFDMTDLIQKLLDAGRPVVSFPIMEYWLDIGVPADYAKAQADASRPPS